MPTKRPLCNYCGIPESQWKNRVCYHCEPRYHCDVRDEDIIEQRIYNWFVKRGVVNNGATLYPNNILWYMNLASTKNVPKYIQQFIEEHRKEWEQ